LSNLHDSADPVFRNRLASLLTRLSLAIDLGEITDPAGFQVALEGDGTFKIEDPRVRSGCWSAGLGAWLA
jgi:hypothetical protein